MNISGLLNLFESLPAYRALRDDLNAGIAPSPLGLLRAARPALLAALDRDLNRPLLVVAGSVDRARSLTGALRDWATDSSSVTSFPEPSALFYERAAWTEDAIIGRLRVLLDLYADATVSPESTGDGVRTRRRFVVASVRALMQRTIPLRQFRMSVREMHVGQVLDLEQALYRWSGLGYEPTSVVELPGQFSHRGGILDIYPPADKVPVRIELFGSEIESIRRFDPATQRSGERVESVTITPAREALPRHGPRVAERVAALLAKNLPLDARVELETHHQGLSSATPFPGIEFYLPHFYSESASLLDYMPADALIVVDDPQELGEVWSDLEAEALKVRAAAEDADVLPADYPLPFLTWDEWVEQSTDRFTLVLGHGEDGNETALSRIFRPGPRFGGQVKPFLDHIRALRDRGGRSVVISQQARRLAELWNDALDDVGASSLTYALPLENLDVLPSAPLTFVHGAMAEGWVLRQADTGEQAAPFDLITDAEVFGWRRPEPRRPMHRRKAAPEAHFADLSPGDYVVHVEYGIGVFRGLVSRAVDGNEREYLLVEYSGRDRLYVPIHQADRLSRYIGADDRPPVLNRLGAAEWRQVKERAKKAAEEIARELLELYAARELAQGYAFDPDTPWQTELEAAFPYFETEDQLHAIADVKTDMEASKPMDRLICGDVGYGKTEVALRAAFKAVMAGKQVAVLVPTTVLAQQHYTNFRQRLAPFPVEIDVLSRFRSPAEQSKILTRLLDGQVDIIVGTHRLLQKDVAFGDLGLLIIDEEQRFGVTHKERLKQMRTEVDVLTMTATPIPRTLYMALTGVRDISIIETPPEERLPINTYIGEYDGDLVRRAILRERDRNGQVFYVHNRVQTISTAQRRLQQLVPEATFAVAHGQMKESELERVMVRFVSGEVDVLVCTSIIESGLDIPNANTLIVERADRFGLAQLYQLRGRVGRGAQRAYAYFFHDRTSRLTEESRLRLETIREATGLGAGYTIAMRDLEMRGAGDLLGARQSGHVAAVGFDLYTRLLIRVVEELKAQQEGKPLPPEPLNSIRIELPMPVQLPDDYVPEVRLRLQIYRRLAELTSVLEINEMEQELGDRFGPLPAGARNLMYQLRLKVLAREAGIESIAVEDGSIVLRAAQHGLPDPAVLQQILAEEDSIGRQCIRMPVTPSWRERLTKTLRAIAQRAIDG
ncbi:MAG: transcription-repair coupling factor [Chloroflexi bacterium]|nr:transcription-repair coupling factor [Chloroflexota bacterium]